MMSETIKPPSSINRVLILAALLAVPAAPLTAACPDGFEPNDGFSQAGWAISGGPVVSYICDAGDVDYWKIDAVRTGDVLVIDLENPPKDYDLYLLRPDRSRAATSREPGTGDERIVFKADAAGTWYALVAGQGLFDPQTPYTISSRVSACALGPAEPNESPQSPFQISDLQVSFARALEICPNLDRDWFSRDLSRGDEIIVTLDYRRQTGFKLLEACIFEPPAPGAVVGLAPCTPGAGDREEIRFKATRPGRHLVRVRALSHAVTGAIPYLLAIEVLAAAVPPPPLPPPFPGCRDGFEPNGTPVEAFADRRFSLDAGSKTSYICTANDLDYWSLPAASGQVIQLELRHSTEEYTLKLFRPLVAGTAPVLARESRVAQAPGVNRLAFVADDCCTWVVEVSEGKGKADTQIPYTLIGSSTACADRNEPDDGFGSAERISGSQTVRGAICHSADVDHTVIRLVAGQRLEATLKKALHDYEVTLFNPWRRQVGSAGASVAHFATITGDHFLRVASRSGQRFDPAQHYELEVSAGSSASLPAGDVRMLDMEISQTIQDLRNLNQLVAKKPAYARLYASGDRRPWILRVTGHLEATLDGAALVPPQVPCVNHATVFPAPAVDTALRGVLTNAVYCRIPPSWLAKTGTLEVSGFVYSPTVSDFNPANNRQTVRLTVGAPIDIELQMVQVRDCGRPTCSPSDGPLDGSYGGIEDRIRQMYPASRVLVRPAAGRFVNWSGEVGTVTAIAALRPARSSRFFMGAVRHPGWRTWWRGRGSFPPTRSSWVEVWDPTRSPWLAAHEIGHNLGLTHVDGCFAPRPGGGFPNYRGAPYLDDGDPRRFYGLNTERTPPEVLLPRHNRDIMTYCRPDWLSYRNFTLSLAALRRGAGLPGPIAPPAPGVSGLLQVRGSISEDGEAAVLPVFRLPAAEAVLEEEDVPEGDSMLLVLDQAGEPIFERPFVLGPPLTEGDGPGASQLALQVPDLEEMARIVILHEGEEIFSRERTPHAPRVEIEPLPEVIEGELRVSWFAEDPDGDPLATALFLSGDGGETWDALTWAEQGDAAELDTTRWPATEQGHLRLLVSDGLNTSEAIAGPFVVPPKAPEATILVLEDGARLQPGEPVLLRASAYDPEDGFLEGDHLVWTSSAQEEPLGYGEDALVWDFRSGRQEIILTATDSSGETATARVLVVVEDREREP